MADYFFDTTVLVAYFKKEDTQTHGLFARILNGQVIAAISAITIAELWSTSEITDQTAKSERVATIDLFEIVTVDRQIAERGGELRRIYNLALPDALIAACAEREGGQFFSKDPHFKRLVDAKVLIGSVYAE
ncbi:MAG: PIN domain-containing protein [Chloroflexi bacterium]|nr:PIN domain-containing protein [Chloroflexota bacterium]